MEKDGDSEEDNDEEVVKPHYLCLSSVSILLINSS
jgi:hypothetical protein